MQDEIHIRKFDGRRYSVCDGIEKYRRVEPGGDWKGYLSFDPEGCFVAEVDGEKSGTVTTVRYDGRFGWIGMVLVHPSKRRSGIGTTLLKKGMEYLDMFGTKYSLWGRTADDRRNAGGARTF